MPLKRPSPAGIALACVVAYALASVVAQAFVRLRLWDMRTLDSNAIDFAWQIELPWRALHGDWSGRDFFFPMGPLWQLFGLTGLLLGPFSAARVITGMQIGTQLGAIAIALWLGRRVEDRWLRVVAVATVALLGYGAGIATLRSLLSLVHLFLYVRDEELGRAPRWSSAVAAAGSATLLMLLSFDRIVFATLGVGAMFAFEVLGRWRSKQSLGVALERIGRYVAAQIGWLGAVTVLGLAVGASPLRWLAEQRAVASSYAVNMAREAEGGEAQAITVLALLAALLAVSLLASRSRELVAGLWIVGALPMMAFALVQPNRGHVFMAAMPLVVVLVVIAARSLESRARRSITGILAAVFVLGWFGSSPGEAWLKPTAFSEARAVAAGQLEPQTEFVTDVGRALDYTRALREREPNTPCIGFSPALTVVHALADVPGPTSARLRWSAEQRRALADAIREARCPYFIYQMGSFDRPDRPNWFIGEDLIAIGELYHAAERIGPATFVLRLRPAATAARATELSSASPPDRERTLGPEAELSIPITGELRTTDLLRIEYSYHPLRGLPLLGAAPKLQYRFAKKGAPLSDWLELTELGVGRRAVAFLAVDPTAAEERWVRGVDRAPDATADAIELRTQPRGRFGRAAARFTAHALGRVTPSTLAAPRTAAACRPSVDLLAEVQAGRALPRNVALRPAERRFLLHPTPPAEAPAEVYFPVRPCEQACLIAEAGIDMPAGSGDGAELEIHVLEAADRPRLISRTLVPGSPTRIEVGLTRWAEQDVLVRMGTHIGQTQDNDFVFVQDARIAHCSARTELAPALSQGHAKLTEGKLTPETTQIAMTGDRGALSYAFQVIVDTCLNAELALDATGSPEPAELAFDYRFLLVVDGLKHELASGSLDSHRPEARVDQLSLHDWFGRPAELAVQLVRRAGRGGRALLKNARIGKCKGQ